MPPAFGILYLEPNQARHTLFYRLSQFQDYLKRICFILDRSWYVGEQFYGYKSYLVAVYWFRTSVWQVGYVSKLCSSLQKASWPDPVHILHNESRPALGYV